MGAIDIETNSYYSPSEALKGKTYKCTECGNRVIFRKGDIRVPHFAHYSQTNTCSYYEHPSESQIHKDAKLLMAKMLTERKNIQFLWNCDYPSCKTRSDCYAFSGVPSIIYKEGDEVMLEYRDKENKWIADIAVVNNGEVRYIIEIKNTHSTNLGRPEPWFEVDAATLIREMNELNMGSTEIDSSNYGEELLYLISCERKNIKRYCYGSFCYKEHWVKRIPGYNKKMLVNECLLCSTTDFYPICDGSTGRFQNGEIKVCIDCLEKDTYEKRIPVLYKPSCNGQCFVQGDDGAYSQRNRRYCAESCELIQCSSCYKPFPKILLDCYGKKCMSCDMSLCMFHYLNVPFSRKEEAKTMGAKWDSNRKKWYIEKDNKNYKEVIVQFK